jgi:anti-sigma B factor antagonist
VKILSSTGLGALVAVLTSLRNRSGDLCLAELTEKVHALTVMTHLIKIFKVYETVERAVASFEK